MKKKVWVTRGRRQEPDFSVSAITRNDTIITQIISWPNGEMPPKQPDRNWVINRLTEHGLGRTHAVYSSTYGTSTGVYSKARMINNDECSYSHTGKFLGFIVSYE